ncbi:MAG: hypothetical protein ACRDF0_04725 [Candidatus Limnocylindria bacterium]
MITVYGKAQRQEARRSFFTVRLWDQDALISALLEHYERLDEALRVELPLKQVWVLAAPEAEVEDPSGAQSSYENRAARRRQRKAGAIRRRPSGPPESKVPASMRRARQHEGAD